MFLNWAISKGFYTRIDTLLTTGKLKWFLFECFLIVLNPYEFFQMVNFRECKCVSAERSRFAHG